MSNRRMSLVVAAIVAVTLVAGIAWAAIPDSGGVIHACYSVPGGAMTVIDPDGGGTTVPAACQKGQVALSFAAKGPTGATGPAGAAGPTGATGAQGGQGPPGPAVAPAAYEITEGHASYQEPPIAQITRTQQTVMFHAYVPAGTYLATLRVVAIDATDLGQTNTYSYTLIACSISGSNTDNRPDEEPLGTRADLANGYNNSVLYGPDLGQRDAYTFVDESPVSWGGTSTQEIARCGRAGDNAAVPATSVIDILEMRLVAVPISTVQYNPVPPVVTHQRQPLQSIHLTLPTVVHYHAPTHTSPPHKP